MEDEVKNRKKSHRKEDKREKTTSQTENNILRFIFHLFFYFDARFLLHFIFCLVNVKTRRTR